MIQRSTTRRYLLERIYKKLLKNKTSRTITFDNIKEHDRGLSFSNFSKVFEELADKNFVFNKPRTKTWYLVEEDPKKYAEILDVDESEVDRLEKIYGRKETKVKGAVVKGSMEDRY